jgi:hypothetical protein
MRDTVDPRDLRRTVQDDIRKVLADPAARGDLLVEALAGLATRHPIEPFRAVLACAVALECPEDEAGPLILAIDRHRSGLEQLMGRDPGFSVAACDLLHSVDRTLREPVFRSGAPSPRSVQGEVPALLEEVLRGETRRARRSGRPLAMVVLAPDGDVPVAPDDLDVARRSLCDSARDMDVVGGMPPDGFVVLLPCTGGRQGLLAAGRFRLSLFAATGAVWSAGVASDAGEGVDAVDLARRAMEGLATARGEGSGQALYRQERRVHPRTVVRLPLEARLRRDGVEWAIVLQDLSLGGALFTVQQRIDPGSEVTLAVRQGAVRPVATAIPSRVLRVADGPAAGRAPWRAAVEFGEESRLRVAGVLAEIGPRLPGEAS